MNILGKLNRLERLCKGRPCPRCAGDPTGVIVVEQGSKLLRRPRTRCRDCGAMPPAVRMIVVPRGSGNPYFDSPLLARGGRSKP